MGAIVVGIDGSDASKAALDWAIEEARLRDVPVEAVAVSEPSATMAYGDGSAAFAPDLIEESARASHQEARRMLDAVIAEAEPAGVQVDPVVVEGIGAASGLIERSADADLLVIGSRGLGGFRGLLLGSVSQQCASHAPCPVVIVRADLTE